MSPINTLVLVSTIISVVAFCLAFWVRWLRNRTVERHRKMREANQLLGLWDQVTDRSQAIRLRQSGLSTRELRDVVTVVSRSVPAGTVYAVSEPEYVGRMPIRTDLPVQPRQGPFVRPTAPAVVPPVNNLEWKAKAPAKKVQKVEPTPKTRFERILEDK